jgi:hypothetical protein
VEMATIVEWGWQQARPADNIHAGGSAEESKVEAVEVRRLLLADTQFHKHLF